MKCSGCGREIPDDSFYCGTCGTPVAPLQNPSAGARDYSAGGGTRMGRETRERIAPAQAANKKWLYLTILVVSLVAVVGLTVGVLLWHSVVSRGLRCDIKGVALTDSQGNPLSLDNIPLGKYLTAKVRCLARFEKGGRSRLDVLVIDAKGNRCWRTSQRVESSDAVQVYEADLRIEGSAGETFRLQVVLSVVSGGETVKKSRYLTFHVGEKTSGEYDIDALRRQALQKILEADSEVGKLIEKKISAEDLAREVEEAEEELERASSADDIEKVIYLAESVIKECRSRSTKYGVLEDQNRETCRRNQALLKKKLIEYYDTNGHLPDNLSEIGDVPSCPSGGEYDYSAPDTTPDTLKVSCSKHGSI